MAIPKLDLNVETKLDDRFREVPEDFEQMQKAVSEYKNHFISLGDSEDEIPEKAKTAAFIGSYSRILLALEDSEEYFKLAFDLYKNSQKVSLAQMTKARLAVTYFWMENFTKSDEYFLSLIDKFRGTKNSKGKTILSYSLVNFGKSKLERGMARDALELFLEAFELNMTMGKMDEIQNIETMIGRTRAILKEKDPDFEEKLESED